MTFAILCSQNRDVGAIIEKIHTISVKIAPYELSTIILQN
jgi:hypothetical protein